MGFFKLLKGELNKLLMRPLLYVLTAVLVVGIFASFLMFNPSERRDIIITDYDQCETVSDVYMTFNNATSSHGKEKSNEIIVKSKQMKDNIASINEDTSLANLEQKVNNEKNAITVYFDDYGHIGDDEATQAEQDAFHGLETALNELKNDFNSIFSKPIVPVITTATNYKDFLNAISETQKNLSYVVVTKHSSHDSFRKYLTESDFAAKIVAYYKNISRKTYDASEIENLNSKIEKTENFLVEINANIEEKHVQEGAKKEDIIKLAKQYNLAASNLYNLVDNVRKYFPYLKYNDSQINSFFDFSEKGNIFNYKIQEDLTKQNFLIDNNLTAIDYSNVFAQNQNSNQNKNAFDLVFFGLEITSFIIIIFTVVLVAGTIAGEQSNGTLKLLLIRPYSRSKVLTSKLTASLIFASIFLIFSTIIFFLIGLFLFGANFSPVLAIFNAQTPFLLHPVVLLLIYLLCLIVKVTIYVLIALAISTIFRSNVAAVGISIVLYIVLSILSVTLSGSYWYGFMPFSNFDLFKYFGGSFFSYGNSSAISILFSAPIFHDVSFWYAFVVDIVLCIVITFCSYFVFAKREIK